MKHIYPLLLLFLSFSTAAQQTTENIAFGGEVREYIQYVPPVYDGSEPVPIVFCFHGLGDSMENFYNIGMNFVADTANFIAVFPQALSDDLFNITAWNSGAGYLGFYLNDDVDDVGFVMAMIDTLSAEYNIDPSRIYATGFSMGGFMSNRLACEQTDVFAAVASVAGTVGEGLTCQPAIPIRIAHFHGTTDATVGYEQNNFGMSVPEWFSFWQSANECIGTPQEDPLPDTADDGYTIDYTRNGACEGGAETVLYTVNGLGHEWLTPANDIFYTTEIWRFFLGIQPQLATGIASNEAKPLKVYPNPARDQLTIALPSSGGNDLSAELINMAGKVFPLQLHRNGNRADCTLGGVPTGSYALRVIDSESVYTARIIVR